MSYQEFVAGQAAMNEAGSYAEHARGQARMHAAHDEPAPKQYEQTGPGLARDIAESNAKLDAAQRDW